MAIEIRPFDRDVRRNLFSCGREPIDRWFKNNSKKCSDRDEYRIFTAHLNSNRDPIGFYALQIGNESMDALASKPDDFTKNYTAFPAVHLAFIGVQRGLQRQGIGTALLADIFDKTYAISQIAGLYALTLQSLDADSTAFYKSIGFKPYSDNPTQPKMLMAVRTIRDLIEAANAR